MSHWGGVTSLVCFFSSLTRHLCSKYFTHFKNCIETSQKFQAKRTVYENVSCLETYVIALRDNFTLIVYLC